MGSRNTFVTSFIYSPDAIKIVREALQSVDAEFCYPRSETDAGFFAGILKTSGEPPFSELKILFEIIDGKLKEIGYSIYFDIVVVCDDAAPLVLQRHDRYGLEIHRSEKAG